MGGERNESRQLSTSNSPRRLSTGVSPDSTLPAPPSGSSPISSGPLRNRKKANGVARTSTAAPNATQVIRQSVNSSRYAEKGTKIRPPTDDPATMNPIMVVRLRWNHRASNG